MSRPVGVRLDPIMVLHTATSWEDSALEIGRSVETSLFVGNHVHPLNDSSYFQALRNTGNESHPAGSRQIKKALHCSRSLLCFSCVSESGPEILQIERNSQSFKKLGILK